MALILYDTDTGEAVKTIDIQEGDSIRVIKGEQVEYMAETVELPFSSFVKLNIEEFQVLCHELSASDTKFLISVLPYLSYKDNCLKNRRGEPMNGADLVRALGVSRSNVERCLTSLIEQDIIVQSKNSRERQLFVNPWIAGRGNRCNKVLATMFRNYRIRSKGGIKWKNLKV